jgi:hypothetical protein
VTRTLATDAVKETVIEATMDWLAQLAREGRMRCGVFAFIIEDSLGEPYVVAQTIGQPDCVRKLEPVIPLLASLTKV